MTTELRELLDAASPRPWRAYDVSEWVVTCPTWELGYTASDETRLVGGDEVALAGNVDQEDASLIAAAVNALPDILDRLEAAEGAVARVEALAAEWDALSKGETATTRRLRAALTDQAERTTP